MNRALVIVSLLMTACSSGSDTSTASADVVPDATDTTDSVEVSDSGQVSDAGADLSPGVPDSSPGVADSSPEVPDSSPEVPDSTPEIDGLADTSPDGTPDSSTDAPTDSGTEPETSDTPWPNNPDKDLLDNPGWESTPAVGTVMPNFEAIDQYGNLVELYDLAMDGKPVVLDVGTWFCEPCKSLAWYLSTGETGVCPYSETILDDLGWWNESYEIIKDLVDTGAIRWVSILYSLGNPVTAQDAAAWHEAFPHDDIVVLADTTLQLQEYLSVEAMPRIDVLDEEMTFLVYHTGGPNKGLQKLLELFPGD